MAGVHALAHFAQMVERHAEGHLAVDMHPRGPVGENHSETFIDRLGRIQDSPPIAAIDLVG